MEGVKVLEAVANINQLCFYELREDELMDIEGGVSVREVCGSLGALLGSLAGGAVGGTVGYLATVTLYDQTSKLEASEKYKNRDYQMSISPKI